MFALGLKAKKLVRERTLQRRNNVFELTDELIIANPHDLEQAIAMLRYEAINALSRGESLAMELWIPMEECNGHAKLQIKEA